MHLLQVLDLGSQVVQLLLLVPAALLHTDARDAVPLWRSAHEGRKLTFWRCLKRFCAARARSLAELISARASRSLALERECVGCSLIGETGRDSGRATAAGRGTVVGADRNRKGSAWLSKDSGSMLLPACSIIVRSKAPDISQ